MKKQPRKHQQLCLEAMWTALNKSPDPILLDLTVGFGKSLICAWVAETLQNAGRTNLILTMTSDLVDQNSKEFMAIGDKPYEPSILCSKLGLNTWKRPVLFATPQSLWAKIKAGHPVGDRHFDMITVDEAHNINAENPNTVYMQIIAHYLAVNPNMRIVGMTGTAYRGKTTIVSKDLLFKKCVYKRTLSEEIAEGNLLPLHFGLKGEESFDFSECHQTKLGKYKEADLAGVIEGKGRLTSKIVAEVRQIAKDGNYQGAFLFGATKEHCMEIMESLPEEISALVTGDTGDKERVEIMARARAGQIRYLVSMNCLFTGVNLPHFGIVAWLRPTESMIMWNQGCGRVVRKCDEIGKDHGLVLDYAGNLDTFGDSDDEGIIEYKHRQLEENDDPLMELDCPKCNQLNLLDARRCIGVSRTWDTDLHKVVELRCDHYFQFVPCPVCEASNDLTARNCRACGAEIIDPNKKLSRRAARNKPQWGLVLNMQLSLHRGKKGKPDTVRLDYLVGNEHFDNPMLTEWYTVPRFKREWNRHSSVDLNTLGEQAYEIVTQRPELRTPTRIHFFKPKGEKYLKIIDKEF
ncbi:DNA helicase [Vibrio phage 1254]|nr:putative DNA repair helicase [Vibrio phage 82E32.1]QZI92826.1 putative DNA repair helicase [Vibrio phage 38E33.6a]QZI92952.1 putative DNA repair helicase [Vibrio phage 82E32.2]QZI93029.1 putative DNA repair helicase [Vibrio phage 82E32.3]